MGNENRAASVSAHATDSRRACRSLRVLATVYRFPCIASLAWSTGRAAAATDQLLRDVQCPFERLSRRLCRFGCHCLPVSIAAGDAAAALPRAPGRAQPARPAQRPPRPASRARRTGRRTHQPQRNRRRLHPRLTQQRRRAHPPPPPLPPHPSKRRLHQRPHPRRRAPAPTRPTRPPAPTMAPTHTANLTRDTTTDRKTLPRAHQPTPRTRHQTDVVFPPKRDTSRARSHRTRTLNPRSATPCSTRAREYQIDSFNVEPFPRLSLHCCRHGRCPHDQLSRGYGSEVALWWKRDGVFRLVVAVASAGAGGGRGGARRPTRGPAA